MAGVEGGHDRHAVLHHVARPAEEERRRQVQARGVHRVPGKGPPHRACSTVRAMVAGSAGALSPAIAAPAKGSSSSGT